METEFTVGRREQDADVHFPSGLSDPGKPVRIARHHGELGLINIRCRREVGTLSGGIVRTVWIRTVITIERAACRANWVVKAIVIDRQKFVVGNAIGNITVCLDKEDLPLRCGDAFVHP